MSRRLVLSAANANVLFVSLVLGFVAARLNPTYIES
jgi:hypothetical protein